MPYLHAEFMYVPFLHIYICVMSNFFVFDMLLPFICEKGIMDSKETL